jgi:hypothetical protein
MSDHGPPPAEEPGASVRNAFDSAEAVAGRNGLPGFCAWRAGLERRYTVMPPWYWNEQDCRGRYVAHIRTAIDWQQREQRINRGNTDFLRSLTGRAPRR